jgi:hypothetical protein
MNMVKILDEVPKLEPIVERILPERISAPARQEYIGWDPATQTSRTALRAGPAVYDGRPLAGTLTQKLAKYGFEAPSRDEPARYEEALREFVAGKELYLRGKPASDGSVSWFALVSDEFSPIDSKAIDSRLREISGGQAPIVRYFRGEDTATLEYKLDGKLPGLEALHLHADLGRHGIWGGDGTMSVRYGVAHYNGVCTNWTLFLHQDLQQRKMRGKVIHRGDVPVKLDAVKAGLGGWADTVVKSMGASRDRILSHDDLKGYIDLYAAKRGMNDWIGGGLLYEARQKGGLSVHDAAYKITEFAQKRTSSDASRKRLEYLAGELILCTDKVLEAVHGKQGGTDEGTTETPA